MVVTRFEASQMQTKVSATAATIFSRVSAPPPPLIIARPCVDLVGTIDINPYGIDFIEIKDSDAMTGESLCGGLGAGDGAANSPLDRGDLVDEEVRRATSADSQDGTLRQPIGHVIAGGPGYRLL
jgi:hypothetical protein